MNRNADSHSITVAATGKVLAYGDTFTHDGVAYTMGYYYPRDDKVIVADIKHDWLVSKHPHELGLIAINLEK
jgi:hypothetical protein